MYCIVDDLYILIQIDAQIWFNERKKQYCLLMNSE